MIIEQFGVKLKRLTLDDIELVRHWRNDPQIQKTMNFREHITSEMQVKWFHSINNPFNYYFLIEYKGEFVGVINAKNVSETEKCGEGGIFVWEKREEFEMASVFASLTILNTVFKKMDFFQKSIIQVRRDNPKAIYYNSMLGYQENKRLSTEEICFFEMDKQNYHDYTEKLNKVAAQLTRDFELPRMYGVYDETLYLPIFQGFLLDEKS